MRHVRIATALAAAVALTAIVGAPGLIQPSPALAGDDDSVRMLLKEVDRLTAEVDRLQKRRSGSPATVTATDNVQILFDELDRMTREINELRAEVARERLAANDAERKLAELQQYITDHDAYGADFQQYRAVRDAAIEAARAQELEARRIRRDQDRAERRARQTEARTARDRQRAEQQRMSTYRKRGFAPLGLDVFMSDVGFSYGTTDTGSKTRIDYQPGIGNYLRVYPGGAEPDFSSMRISGSVLNAAEEVRNVGVAIAFFDRGGTQIGHEIVQINNARPDVPYPFTTTIEMAADAPFASTSQYVLYADPIE